MTELRRALGEGARGLKLHPRGEGFTLSHPVVEDLIEVYAQDEGPVDIEYVERDWGRRWPAEEVWKARLVADAMTRR